MRRLDVGCPRQSRLSDTLNTTVVTRSAGVVGAIAFAPVAGFHEGNECEDPDLRTRKPFLAEHDSVTFAAYSAPAGLVVAAAWQRPPHHRGKEAQRRA